MNKLVHVTIATAKGYQAVERRLVNSPHYSA